MVWTSANPAESVLPLRTHIRTHAAYVDGLRAIGAILVIIHHCFLQIELSDVPLFAWLNKNAYLFLFGHYRVDLFLVLSGFCLAIPVVKKDGRLSGGPLRFFEKRARRILPPYFFALAFSLVLIWFAIGEKTGTLWDSSLPVDLKAVVTHLLLVQNLVPGYNVRINYPLWSIAAEWQIYLLFPVLIALRRRWGAPRITALAIVFSYAALFVCQHTRLRSLLCLTDCGANPQYLGLFAMGLFGADIVFGKRPPFPQLRRPASALALLVVTTVLVILVSAIRPRHGHTLPMAYVDFFAGLWAASVMIAGANAEIVWLTRMLSWRPLVFVGTFAYSVYLIHAPLIQVLWQYVFVPLHGDSLPMFLALCVVGTPAILGASYLFFLACERPFLNTRKQETMAETERDAALSPAP